MLGRTGASGAPKKSDEECAELIETIKAADWYLEQQSWLDGIMDAMDAFIDAFDFWGPDGVECD